ncbi:MAG: cytosine permease, partial [Brachybacterium tyrofermentans]
MTMPVPDVDAADAPVDPDYPLTPVPRSARRGVLSISVVLIGFTIFAPTLMAGASIGAAFPFAEFLAVLLVGSVVLGSYVAAIGFLGARTGLTTVVMSRYTFGTAGSKVVSLLLGGTQVGWYGVAVGTIGQMTALAFGWESAWAPALVMIAVSVLMMLTALYGYEGMYWVSLVSTPLILILAFWITGLALTEVGGIGGLFDIAPTTTMTWAAAVTTVVGTFASAGTQAANWTRFAKRGRDAVVACAVGFAIGNGLMVFFGAVAAIAFGEGDFTTLLLGMGMIGWGLFFLFGNLWKSNADAAYAFGVAGAEMASSTRKGPFIIGGVAIGTVLALTGVEGHIIGYLS